MVVCTSFQSKKENGGMSIKKKKKETADAFRLTLYRMMRYEKASQNKEMQASNQK